MSRLDRRALFASGAAAALLAATGLSADTPRRGGTLRLAVPRDGSLDLLARGAVFDTLTEIAPDGTLRGELATDWRAENDARTWHFTLRGDVRFHDGAALATDDVRDVLQQVGRAEITGQRTLRLDLASADPGLPFLLAGQDFCIPKSGEVVNPLAQAVGTGCYKVDRAQDDRHFRASRVSGHHKGEQAGWADAIEIIVIPDPDVRTEALRDGYVDVAVLPKSCGLDGEAGFRFCRSGSELALVAARGVGIPTRIGSSAKLDDGRIAERWWMT